MTCLFCQATGVWNSWLRITVQGLDGECKGSIIQLLACVVHHKLICENLHLNVTQGSDRAEQGTMLVAS